MNNNSWFKKEIPLQTVIGLGGGATGFGAHSSAASKLYVDDVFSTDVWLGNESARTIASGVDNNKGALVWVKSRNDSHDNHIVDTVRGANELIYTNLNSAQANTANRITGFTDNGYTLGSAGQVNGTNAYEYTGWNFRKQKGFCDIVTYTGNGSARTISHGLGSIPGLIMIKGTSSVNSWYVYHKELGATKYLMLNNTNAEATQTWFMNDTEPTSSVFSLGTSANVNGSGETYVAYIFADGASNEATSRSVDFDGSSDYLLSTSSDYSPGTGDFTMEAWVNIDAMSGGNATNGIYQLSSTNGAFTYGGIALLYKNAGTDTGENRWELYGGNSTNQSESTTNTGYAFGQWVHTAIVKTSSTIKLYINGEERISAADTQDYSSYQYLGIGAAFASSYNIDGKVSNFKLTIGEALYTAAFTPTNVPLTTTSQSSTASNVKILCCNNSSVTGSTVAAGTITSNGTVTASTDNPNFVEPAATIFGENEDQNIIKCGSYEGNNNDNGTEIDLGWEPSLLIIKSVDTADDWVMFDNLRGMTIDGVNDQALFPNLDSAEAGGGYLTPTSTGFKLTTQSDRVNNDSTYIYMAIRSSDGYVGKLPSAGTDAFTMDTGNSSGTIPTYDSGFPVDFAFHRQFNGTSSWNTSARIIQTRKLITNDTAAAATDNNNTFDSNLGWAKNNGADSNFQSWMWKRGQGMGVVTYKGNGSNAQGSNAHAHNLGQTPEMIWIHPLSGGAYSGVTHWTCSHKGLNGGTNPWQYTVSLNNDWAEAATSNFGNTAPTSTHFYVGDPGNARSNVNDGWYMAMLFASANDVDGNAISKLGSYTGTGAAWSGSEVTCGFQPRFIIIKRRDAVRDWCVYDTLRGIDNQGSGTEEKILFLNNNDSEDTAENITLTSTGFTFPGGSLNANASSGQYIFYAHA